MFPLQKLEVSSPFEVNIKIHIHTDLVDLKFLKFKESRDLKNSFFTFKFNTAIFKHLNNYKVKNTSERHPYQRRI